jgi:uncharacterized OB-fold protein
MTATTPAEYAVCTVCGTPYFPVHPLSPCGHDGEPSLRAFDTAGTVYSWTLAHGPDGSTPMAMVDFLDGALRVTAPVVGTDAVTIGDRMSVHLADDPPFVLTPA